MKNKNILFIVISIATILILFIMMNEVIPMINEKYSIRYL